MQKNTPPNFIKLLIEGGGVMAMYLTTYFGDD